MKKLLTITLACVSLTSFAKTTTIPSGSSGSATLQTDINISEQTGAVPIKLLITGDMELPNDNHSSATKDCFISALAIGNFASNRISINFNEMICDGATYKISGWAVDEDKKYGLASMGGVGNTLSVKQGHTLTVIFSNSLQIKQ